MTFARNLVGDASPRALWSLAVLLALLLVAPAILGKYWLSVLILILYFAYVGQAWNILMGFAGQREAKAEIAHDRAGEGCRRDGGEDAGPWADAVMKEEAGGDVAAEAGIERVAQRKLAGEAHQDVPGLTDIGEVEDQDQHGEQVVAGKERRDSEQRQHEDEED